MVRAAPGPYNAPVRPSPDATRLPLLYLPGIDGTGRLLHRQPRLHEAYDVRCLIYPHHPPPTYDQLADAAPLALTRRRAGCAGCSSSTTTCRPRNGPPGGRAPPTCR